VAFREQIEHGVPFATPSGKIEIYSERLAQRANPLVPPIPRYLDLPEGPTDPLRATFPLQMLSPKDKRRTNSTMDNVLAGEQAVTLHPDDAAARGLEAGQIVLVRNARGEVRVPLRTSSGQMPGVAVLNAGGWDVAERGCPNVLTTDTGTAWGQSSTQQSVLVEVQGVSASSL
jgi:anaerobic dimethyl sulfoxide reductase subunit A